MDKQRKHLYDFGAFRLDETNRLLLKDGELVHLKRKAVDTLVILVTHQGEVVSKDELIHTLWPDTFVEESNLSQYIYLLRKALGLDNYIVTISGRGYCFTAEVTETYEQDDSIAVGDHTPTYSEIYNEPDLPASNIVDNKLIEQASQLLPASAKYRKKAVFLSVPIVAGILVGFAWWGNFGSRNTPEVTSRLVFATSYIGNESEPAFSPDGKQIAFTWDGGKGDNLDIYVKLLDVGSPLRLTTFTGWDRWPVWSPDGRFIAFIRGTENWRKLIVIPALGGAERDLGEVWSGLDWSSDGKTLAIVEQQKAQTITLLSVETGQRRKLTSPPTNIMGDTRPVFSPDGKKLAFIRTDGGAGNIYVIPVTGGEARQVTFDNNRIQSIRWMQDGSHLIFASNRGGSFQLWKIAESSGNPEQLKFSGSTPQDVALSFDGTRLAFSQTTLDSNIWRLNLAERGVTFTNDAVGLWTQFINSTLIDDSPQFSPDGTHIAFASTRSGYSEIWICAKDGTNFRQITQMQGPSTGSPRWSPDGREIAFDSRLEGHADIFVISAEGGGQLRRLTNNPALDVAPSWSHDGRWIYFSSMRNGARQIWKVPTGGGSAIQVTQNGGFDSFESADGKYLYYTKDRATAGVWRLSLTIGQEVSISGLESVKEHRSWTVNDQGIYFVHSIPQTAHLLKFYDFATCQITNVSTLLKYPVSGPPGLAVSPDGRTLLYTQLDSTSSDIMLAENFH